MIHLHPQKPSLTITTPEEFAGFYEQTHLSVYRYMMALCAGDSGEAEDMTAEAFFRAWGKREQFSGTAGAGLGWVITIARNILIDHRRREGLHPLGALSEDGPADQETPVEDILVDREQLQQVLDSIRSLPIAMGNILTLRFVLGWQVKRIAEHLGIAENTASVQLRRALALLQRELAHQQAAAESVNP